MNFKIFEFGNQALLLFWSCKSSGLKASKQEGFAGKYFLCLFEVRADCCPCLLKADDLT
ncbi:hypothetical protein SynBOUM118_00620 [Synechococcus sp. BOUM118]|nr:hypothetical protein SynBOUM118_00620 [Synechococcus sp. BOUM118]